MSTFAALNVYRDDVPRSAAQNMAIDEALLEAVHFPSIRFYRWDSPALSFGYFGRFADVAHYAIERDLVRRWTGGGIVFHGEDLTYSIIIPSEDAAFSASPMSIYGRVHRALRDALVGIGEDAELLAVAAVSDRRSQAGNATVGDRRYSKEACFANPVHADVMLNGRKVAGAAQRRTRAGLLHQGSIQNVDLANGLAKRFASKLCNKCDEKLLDGRLIERAQEIAEEKYGSSEWLRRR